MKCSNCNSKKVLIVNINDRYSNQEGKSLYCLECKHKFFQFYNDGKVIDITNSWK